MKLKPPKLLARTVPDWQMKKLELAQGIIEGNKQIVEQNEKMIELLTLQYTAMVNIQNSFSRSLKSKGGC
jgi:hypothetical protein